eukprot:TRINITY_DN6357_c0_g1_i2.p1 TRINITY_DN6357_c0_g1~~TRINITY_DN6357_c0_g1_i2.p1  ORF type:complete len:210 (-),score=44.15 TRINITY_DN6357_c0_g1_i2:46-627(-)
MEDVDVIMGPELERKWEEEYFGASGAPQQKLHPKKEVFLRTKSHDLHEFISASRQMYFVIDMCFQMYNAILTGCYPQNSSFPTQIYLILVGKIGEFLVVLLLRPFILLDMLAVITLSKMCNLASAICCVILLDQNLSYATQMNIGWAMLLCQIIPSLAAVWSVTLKEIVIPFVHKKLKERQEAAAGYKPELLA